MRMIINDVSDSVLTCLVMMIIDYCIDLPLLEKPSLTLPCTAAHAVIGTLELKMRCTAFKDS